jgi:Zn-dependent metalloprotease
MYGIIPPHILKKIAENGSEEQKERALKNLEFDKQIKERRLRSPKEAKEPSKEMNKCRKIYDSQNTENQEVALIRDEDDIPSDNDSDVNYAYDYSGATWDLFAEVYGRNSIDNAGMEMISNIHYSQSYNNAFWDGKSMSYGDGDQEIFQSFLGACDVAAHELTHGITQYTCNLAYYYQSGALNESISDCFASCVKQRILGQTADQADWKIGQGILVGDHYALRSMKAPGSAYVDHPILGTDPQPADMEHFLDLPMEEDNGGVHLNSGIANRSFYLTSLAIGGYSWEKAGLIWYKTITSNIRPTATFKEFAKATVKAASTLYGKKSNEVKSVQDAWATVGVL